MAKPISILRNIKGMARDFSIDALPPGYVWDLVDYIPSQRGAQLEGRGPWSYLTSTPLSGPILGGLDAVFNKGEKLLVVAGTRLYDQPRVAASGGSAVAADAGSLGFGVLHNGKFYNDKAYFADSTGLQTPMMIGLATLGGPLTFNSLGGANVPKAKLLDIWRNRLIAAGDPANPNNLYWAPIGMKGSDWDSTAWWGFTREIKALGPLGTVLMVFHDGMTMRVKGGMTPPAAGLSASKVDIVVDTLSDQYGCSDPASVVPWQENLIFCNSHGVQLTDGSTVRSISDQGGIGQIWRYLYGLKRAGTQVSCGIYLDRLFVSILTQWDTNTSREDRSFTFVCDLASRAWYRLTNVNATAFIPSTTGMEQLWFGTDNYPLSMNQVFANRLARVAGVFSGLTDADPDFLNPSLPDAVDPNGVPILPRITTGWEALTKKEGQKRMRAIYVSHATQKQTPFTGVALTVGYRLTPVVLDSFVDAAPISGGGLPFSNLYDRKRLPVGRPGYGIQVHVEQVLPSHISRLYDIGIEAWPVDEGRVS